MGTVTNSAFASATFCDLGEIFHSNLSGINTHSLNFTDDESTGEPELDSL